MANDMEQPTNPEEEPRQEETFDTELKKLKEETLVLFGSLKTYKETFDPTVVSDINSNATTVSTTFMHALEKLLSEDEYPHYVQLNMIDTLQRGADSERVSAINKIVGHDLLQNADFSRVKEKDEESVGYLDHEEKVEIIDKQVKIYVNNLSADITSFLTYIKRKNQSQENQVAEPPTQEATKSNMERLKEAATIAGGVALGVIIADGLNRFKRR